jgi:hypothetical protein
MNFQLDEIDPTMVKMKNTDGITFAAHWMGWNFKWNFNIIMMDEW